MATFFDTIQHELTQFIAQNPYFHNGGTILGLTRLMDENRTLFDENLQRVAASFTNPITKEIWERAMRHLDEAAANTFARIVHENRNKVAERFFDGAGSLHVVLFDRDENHWHHTLPAAAAAVYADLARHAMAHRALSTQNGFQMTYNTGHSVFLNILLTQKECLFTRNPCVPTLAQIPPTPSETTEDSDDGGPRQMDVDAANVYAGEPDPEGPSDAVPEGARQIQFLQRHNARSPHSTQSQSDFPWAGQVE